MNCANPSHYTSWWHTRRAYWCTTDIEQRYFMAVCRARVTFQECKDAAWDACLNNLSYWEEAAVNVVAGSAGAAAGFAAGGPGGAAVGTGVGMAVGYAISRPVLCRLDSTYRAARAECKYKQDEKILIARIYKDLRKQERLDEATDAPYTFYIWDFFRHNATEHEMPSNGLCDECESDRDDYLSAIGAVGY